ncbi:MAG TPA: class II aldolase/adducin family protein, partial [Gemmatimonadales bacterium]|nr:class II aldolase/adducin family protein [Gemmatimonadales bacterium]
HLSDRRNQALLLANHGAVTMGRTLDEAWIRMESLEHAARIITAARTVGEPKPLTSEAVERLQREREGEGDG